ncbi:type VII secretion protein EccB [Streptomyces sp. TLI_171]|uniref:type VII secretion protein EccB n=1 Tax=Streptomyces sp. TLI_171 TaxID=1938859 RepID=UPI000C1A1158|nr:type VII secretion protein EccB [Streptomyces sp. TLI_171]RKE22039.1 type VII secretion protein EccB [Streptomyces sp. TLI_171]
MQTKRDQVQAHMFLMGRLASGLLRSNPDNDGSPGVRTHKGLAVGLAVSGVLSAGAALLGLVSPGGVDSWRADGTLVIEKGTGTRYLYLDGRLRPVLNQASAMLLVGAGKGPVEASAGDLADTPRGAPLGTAGAPQSLPATTALSDAPWQVCSGLTRDTAGTATAATRLTIGFTDPGQALQDTEALLVQGPDGVRHLVWHGTRLRLDTEHGAQSALGLGSAAARPVSAAFINALPVGPDLTPPHVTDLGAAGPDLAGTKTRIGQVFAVQVPGSAVQYHQLTTSGLVRLTALGAALTLGDPEVRAKAYDDGAPTAVAISAAAVQGRSATIDASPGSGLPDAPPHLASVPVGSLACAQVRPSAHGGAPVAVSTTIVHAATNPDDITDQPADHVAGACLPVDLVEAKAGHGVLAQALSSTGTALGDARYLVTDSGVRYRITSDDALAALGYNTSELQGVPSALLLMVAAGPDLDPAAAASGRTESALPGCPAGVGAPSIAATGTGR